MVNFQNTKILLQNFIFNIMNLVENIIKIMDQHNLEQKIKDYIEKYDQKTESVKILHTKIHELRTSSWLYQI